MTAAAIRAPITAPRAVDFRSEAGFPGIAPPSTVPAIPLTAAVAPSAATAAVEVIAAVVETAAVAVATELRRPKLDPAQDGLLDLF